jgi:hypothetical protein
MKRSRMVSASVVALAIGSAACSSNASSDATTTSKVTTTTQRPTTTSAPASTTTTGQTRCTSKNLTVTAGQSGGAAGHVITPVVFTNTGVAPCTIFGYPGAAAIDGSGSQVAQATRTPSPGPSRLTVAPGASASALVTNTSVPSGSQTSCPTWAGLLVTPPNDTQATKISISVPGCDGFTVSAVVAGSTGS